MVKQSGRVKEAATNTALQKHEKFLNPFQTWEKITPGPKPN